MPVRLSRGTFAVDVSAAIFKKKERGWGGYSDGEVPKNALHMEIKAKLGG